MPDLAPPLPIDQKPAACPGGCGCVWADDADAGECGCDGPCRTEAWADEHERYSPVRRGFHEARDTVAREGLTGDALDAYAREIGGDLMDAHRLVQRHQGELAAVQAAQRTEHPTTTSMTTP